MSITKIVSVPSELPHAHIYLDDVQQICDILTEAVRAELKDGDEVAVRFYTKDLMMETVDDLKSYGGSLSDFRMTVSSRKYGANTSLSFSFFSEPTISLYLQNQEASWATYSKVKAVLDTRQLVLKNTLERLPYWLKVALWALAAFIVPLLFVPLRTPWFVDVSYFVVFGTVLILAALPNRVSLVVSHEKARLGVESRKAYVKGIILLFAGAIIGKFVEFLAQRIKTH